MLFDYANNNCLNAAPTPPLIAQLMHSFGWRACRLSAPPWVRAQNEWTAAFVLASVFVWLSGLIWLGIDATRRNPVAPGILIDPHQSAA